MRASPRIFAVIPSEVEGSRRVSSNLYSTGSLDDARDDSASCSRRLSPARCHCEIFPFRPPPAAQALANLFAQTKIGNETIVELAPAGIHFAETSRGGAIFAKGDQTPPIKFHHQRGDTPRPALKRQPSKRALGITINWTNESDIITGDVK